MGSYLCCKTIRLFELGTVEDAMRVAKPLIVMTAAIVFVAGQGRSAIAQTPAANREQTSPEATPQATVGSSIASPSDLPAGSPRKTFTVPAGTKVLLQLRSSVNTKSARPGDGVYLSSTFPV